MGSFLICDKCNLKDYTITFHILIINLLYLIYSFYGFQIHVLSEQLNEAYIKLNKENETMLSLK